ncbi:MAG: hypothetical protein J6A56_02085, partial [Clostridia bacterium]|nr:hypothetical protein [Clostridia bacterium]
MREKIYNILNKLYGIVMFIGFFAGIIPVIPFVFAICIGGPTGEAISLFLADQFYPVVIAIASIAVLIGVVAMYVNK